MTPEEAEDIYNEAYSKASGEHLAGISPLIQADLRKKAWKAVIDAFNKESDEEWAKRYLAIQETYKPLTYKFTNDIKKQEMSDEELKQL